MAKYAACVASALLLAAPLSATAGQPKYFGDKKVQARLRDEVGRILPAGWTITNTRVGVAPPDWHTQDPKAGFLVEGGNSVDSFEIYFLPLDWIGIRKVPNRAPFTCYWEGILAGEKYKTITAGNDVLQHKVQQLFDRSMHTPSLVNSGYDRAIEIFKGKLKTAEQTARALIEKHCNNAEEFREAAHSLIVLGVPAKAVYLRAAREVQGADKDLFCSALGLMGGDDAIGLLCEIAADSTVPDQRRKYAVMALCRHTDKRIVPALHAALKDLRDEDALNAVVRAPALLRHKAAIPDFLAAFKRSRNVHYKSEITQALAALRSEESIPEIRRFVEELRLMSKKAKKSDWLIREATERAELAILRLTGDWGAPGKEMRLRLMPPAQSVLGQKMHMTIYVENIGTKPFRSWFWIDSGLTIDGKDASTPVDIIIGRVWEVHPGQVHHFTHDLAKNITTAGRHTVQYAVGDARSNVISVTVKNGKTDR